MSGMGVDAELRIDTKEKINHEQHVVHTIHTTCSTKNLNGKQKAKITAHHYTSMCMVILCPRPTAYDNAWRTLIHTFSGVPTRRHTFHGTKLRFENISLNITGCSCEKKTYLYTIFSIACIWGSVRYAAMSVAI